MKQEVIAIASISPLPKPRRAAADSSQTQLDLVEKVLDDGKAEDVIVIDLRGKSNIADYMVIATGRSHRQVAALGDHLLEAFKDHGYGKVPVEGLAHSDWVLVDGGDVIVHLFRPEVRSFYNLEKMWGVSFDAAAGAVS